MTNKQTDPSQRYMTTSTALVGTHSAHCLHTTTLQSEADPRVHTRPEGG